MSSGIEIVTEDHPTQWTVHVLGPDDFHHFNDANGLLDFLEAAVAELREMYPRDSEYAPMIRLVVSPPNAVAAERLGASRG